MFFNLLKQNKHSLQHFNQKKTFYPKHTSTKKAN